jgi:UDP-N-acetyl-D-mannosaminuronic acid transferase (WecB/TagA/CpsF family)
VHDNSSCADQRYQEYERNIDALIANVHQLRQQCEQHSSEIALCGAKQQQVEDENARLRRSLTQHENVVAVHRVRSLRRAQPTLTAVEHVGLHLAALESKKAEAALFWHLGSSSSVTVEQRKQQCCTSIMN